MVFVVSVSITFCLFSYLIALFIYLFISGLILGIGAFSLSGCLANRWVFKLFAIDCVFFIFDMYFMSGLIWIWAICEIIACPIFDSKVMAIWRIIEPGCLIKSKRLLIVNVLQQLTKIFFKCGYLNITFKSFVKELVN